MFQSQLEIIPTSKIVEQGLDTLIGIRTTKDSSVGIIALEHNSVITPTLEKSFLISNALKRTLTCESIQETSTGDTDGSLKSNEAISSFQVTSSTPKILFIRSFEVGNDGRLKINETVPDTKSSYITISGFSENIENVVSLAEPVTIETVKKFFVEVDIPRRVSLGDVMMVEVFVFNFISNAIDDKVHLVIDNKDAYFEFAEPLTNGKSESFVLSSEEIKTFVLNGSGVKKVCFFVKPVKKGFLKLKANASTGSGILRIVQKNIYVEGSKLKTGIDRSKQFSSKKGRFDSSYIPVSKPQSYVEGSIQNEVQINFNPEDFDEFDFDLKVTYTPLETGTEIVKTFHFDSSTTSSSQKLPVPMVRGLRINTEGSGFVANVRIVQLYLEKPVSSEERFLVVVSPYKDHLQVCISLKNGLSEKEVVVEANLPNGFEFDENSRGSLLKIGATNIEFSRKNTLVKFFFASISTSETCVKIQANRNSYIWTEDLNYVRVYEKEKEGLSCIESV